MTEAPKRQPIWNNLLPRLISAVIMAGVLFIPFYLGGYYWAATIFILGARAIWEWVKMTDVDPSALSFLIPMATLAGGIYLYYSGQFGWLYYLIGAGMGLAFIERLIRGKGEWFWSPFGVLYIVLPCVGAILMRSYEVGIEAPGFKLLAYLMLIVIAADVGAYFGGSYFKGPKLVPKLSPKKTWSGLISGIILGVIFGALMGLTLKMGPLNAGLLAIPIVLVSVFGDFLESAVKRRMNVKDASDLLPGHGGILDRLDSLLMVVFVAFLLTTYVVFYPDWI